MRGILTILPIAALTLLSSVPASLANGINYVVPYFGFDVIEDSHFEYIGMNVALDSTNPKAGFLLHGFAGFGGYNYDSSGVPGGQVEGDATWLRGMVGYQMMIPDYRFTTSVGIDWQDNRLSLRMQTILCPAAGPVSSFKLISKLSSRSRFMLA